MSSSRARSAMRSSVAKGRLTKISMRRRRLAYSSFSRVERSAAPPVNLAGSGNGHAPVTALSPKSGQAWSSSVSQSAMTKSTRGASGPANTSHDLQCNADTSWPSACSLAMTSGIGTAAGSEPAE
jgi:hypothetical protein